jgi:hypothetical protein
MMSRPRVKQLGVGIELINSVMFTLRGGMSTGYVYIRGQAAVGPGS